MHKLPAPQDILKELEADDLFKDWSRAHNGELTHFFCSVSPDFKAKTSWEIGFLEDGKITVFAALKERGFEIKPADDVFKKPGDEVEPLKFNEAKIGLDSALEEFKKKLPEHFPNEVLGDGFVVLQTFKGDTIWNFSFITKTLKFVNIKVGANDGKEHSHDVIELIHKE